MSPRDRLLALWRWLLGPRGPMLLAVSILFVLMVASFVNIPWNLPAAKCGGTLCEVPVMEGPGGITDALFGDYVFLVVLIALVLAVCMIGGVYLAKTEEGAP